MAKAKQIPGLDCDGDALPETAKVLLERFEEVLEFREAALDPSDPKGVHDMRVALRRLRSALRDSAPLLGKRALGGVRKELKALADVLGAVRDPDVFVAELESLRSEAAESEAVKEGLAKLEREQRGLREIARMDLAEALDPGKINDLRKRFRPTIDRAAGRKKSRITVSFTRAGRDSITGNLEDLLELGRKIYEPFERKALHRLRIAAKRLRYAVKLFAPCLGDAVGPFDKEIGRLQTFLGEIHDCDVWIESLRGRLSETKEPGGSDYRAAVWLLSELVNRRAKAYRAALGLWAEWQTNGFADRLRAAVGGS